MAKNIDSTEADPIYCPENVSLFEAIYGKNLISIGGVAAIDNMFSDLDIRGLKALDLGFGLGGVAFYLAENYQMAISGVEVHSWMAHYAKKHAPRNLPHELEFDIYNANGELPYKAESFDLVYSKGVLNHVHDKESLFYQVHSVLKPGGLFVIADWIFPHSTTETSGPLVCETKQSYEQALKNTGFDKIEFRNDSDKFLVYIKMLLENLTKRRELIEQGYGKELFTIIWKQHEDLIKLITHNGKSATRIIARKNN